MSLYDSTSLYASLVKLIESAKKVCVHLSASVIVAVKHAII